MATLQWDQDQKYEAQSEVLIKSIASNPLLPETSSALTNKGLNTTKKQIILAINEVLSTALRSEATVGAFQTRYNSEIGATLDDASLLASLHEIDENIILAIVKTFDKAKTSEENISEILTNLEDYAKKEDLPDLSDFDLSDFTTKDFADKTSGYVIGDFTVEPALSGVSIRKTAVNVEDGTFKEYDFPIGSSDGSLNIDLSEAGLDVTANPVDLSEYATKEDLANVDVDLTDYAKKEDLEDYATKEDLANVDVDLTDYAKKEDLEDYATKEDLANVDVDLTDYALKTDIPDVDGFVTEEDLEDFVVVEDLEDLVSNDFAKKTSGYVIGDFTVKPEDHGVAIHKIAVNVEDGTFKEYDFPIISSDDSLNISLTEAGIDISADAVDLSTYAKTSVVESALALKADKTQIPDVSSFITASDLPDLTPFATTSAVEIAISNKADKTEIPDISGLAATTDVNAALALKADKTELPDLDEYALKTDLDDYAKTGDIPDISNLATKTEVSTGLSGKVDNDTLDDYALKTEIPVIIAGSGILVSEDDGEITIHATGEGSSGTGITIVDNLDSTVATSVLSAKQGKVLNDTKLNIADVLSPLAGAGISVEVDGSAKTFTINSTVSPVTVEDSLTSSSAANALSAAKGKYLEDYKADKTELPDVSNFVTESDLDDYAKTTDVESALDLKADKTEIPDISNLAVASTVTNLLAAKADKTEIPNVSLFITADDLPDTSNFATKSEIPNISGLAVAATVNAALELKADKTELPDLDDYALKADLPDVDGFVTEEDLDDYAKKTDIPSIPDLSDFLTEDDLPDLSGYAETSTVNTALALKADKTELPNLSSYARKTDLDDYLLINDFPDLDVYRLKATKIILSDLASGVLTHTNLSGKNAESAYLHLTQEQINKYDGFETTINGLLNRVADLESLTGSTPPPPTPISLLNITGVTVPVKGAAPKTAITSTAQYTGSITWSPVNNPFNPETIYTATINITPKEGYTLEGVAENSFVVAGTTSVSNAVNSGTITAVFPATAPALTITSLNINGITPPATGGFPTSTVADNAQYTATLSWNPTDSPYEPETVYTATITVTPKFGYTLAGVAANSFIVGGSTATNGANSGVITAVFPETASAGSAPTGWTLEFVKTGGAPQFDLATISGYPDWDEDTANAYWYGPEYDGIDRKVRLYVTSNNSYIWQDPGEEIPLDGIDSDVYTGSSGEYRNFAFDYSLGTKGKLVFGGGGAYNRAFRIVYTD